MQPDIKNQVLIRLKLASGVLLHLTNNLSSWLTQNTGLHGVV